MYLWLKAFHIIAATAWMAGLFQAMTGLNFYFEVQSFWAAFFGALVAAVVSFLLTRFLGVDRE